MEQFNKDVQPYLTVAGAIAGVILSWVAVFRPIWICIKTRKTKRMQAIADAARAQADAHNLIIGKLDAMDLKISMLSDCTADIQRENIEKAYCMFVLEHGYCPSGMKEAVADSFANYQSRGYNHIAKQRVDEILALPEFPPKKKGECP